MASTTIGRKQMFAVMQAARQEGLVVRIYTHLSGVLASRLTAQPLGKEGVALTVKPAGLSTSQRAVKRGLDVVLATIGVIVVSPILLLAAIAVGITSGGPVLFRQQRVTEGARTFVMYKFRTMTKGAEHGAESRDLDMSVPFFKLKADPRLTRVGKALRRWSIDELPQLFNVLIGDMSLVGPRPLPAQQVSANIELLGPRHEVRSGITGWWQIKGRSDLDHEEAIRMDHFYIENWSPALDAYILLKTAGALFTRKGAY
jgi:lipopolysaccharide/colanic/teichoic acid biosynthesis glycosyltransferase